MGKRGKQRRAAARAKLMGQLGPDASGNYGVNPMTARGHVVEVAPKELRSNANSSQFPKRVMTQRMIDRYLTHKHITNAEWQAASVLWVYWCEKGLQAKVTAGYDPVVVQSSSNMDGRLAKYLDGALGFTRLMKAVPYHLQGVVRAVVIDDRSASDWARSRRLGRADSERHGMACLRQGLSALAEHLGLDIRGG